MLYNLPPELFLAMCSHMSYLDLLRASCVCCSWRNLILGSSQPSKTLFKTISNVNAEEGRALSSLMNVEDKHRIRLHPALSAVSYLFGDDYENVYLHLRCKGLLKLNDLDIRNDYACIPSVTELKLNIQYGGQRQTATRSRYPLIFHARNPDGVRVSDIMLSLVSESRRKCDLVSFLSGGSFSSRLCAGQKPALHIQADILGKERYFHSFKGAKWEGTSGVVDVETMSRQL